MTNSITKPNSQAAKFTAKIGDIVEGAVLKIGRNEIYLDINGLTTGIVRGPELTDESGEFTNLKKGDKISATIIDLENERGLIELSFRSASHKKAWDILKELMEKKETVPVKVMEINRGGLLVRWNKIQGFLPVSQLKAEHYPRVEGGDKNKILDKLKQFINQTLTVKIITVDKDNEKLIVSEKETITEGAPEMQHKIGDVVEGKITGIVDFGAFVTFDNTHEGLVHISEIAWQRLDHPSEVLKIGDKIKAEIIGITEDGKVSLSIRKLIPDPWSKIKEKYSINQEVAGKVIKVNPFGLFVELDPEIHGLAHISELSDKSVKNVADIAKIGDTLKFKIVSIEPEDHRLGLSLKGVKQ